MIKKNKFYELFTKNFFLYLFIFISIGIFYSVIVSAQLGYNNPNLPKIESPEIPVAQFNNNTVNVNNSNCWQGNCLGFNNSLNQFFPFENRTRVHCSNVTGQSTGVCTTSNVQFVNITTTDRFLSTLSGVSGVWHSYYVLGTFLEIGRVTSELGVFQIKSLANLDIYFSNDDTTAFVSASDTGYVLVRAISGFFVDNGAVRSFESNVTRTHIYNNASFTGTINNFTNNIFIAQNTTIKGLRHDWAVSNGIINATGVNITSNHQTYNITANTALDTTYNNTLDRVVYIDVSFTSLVPATANAYITAYVNGTYRASEGQDWREAIQDIGQSTDYHHLGFYVQPTQRWSLNSSTASGGSVALERVILTVI